MPNPVTIELRPGQELTNRTKVVRLLSEAEDYIWITNWYFRPRHLVILGEAISENKNISEIKLLLNIVSSVVDLETLKNYLELFKKQYKFENIEIKMLTDKKIAEKEHDRYYFTRDEIWNFIELDTLLRNQRATIALLQRGDYEQNKKDFELLWNDEKSLELIKNYDDLEENVKKRELEKEKRHEESKEKISNENQKLQKKIEFSIYKQNKDHVIEAKEKKLIEIDNALKELENLDIWDGSSDYSSENWHYIGFTNLRTNESLQFVHETKKWYAEIPILDEDDKWEGYTYKTRGGLEEMKTALKSFFNNDPIKNSPLNWKFTRFNTGDDSVVELISKDKENWEDLR